MATVHIPPFLASILIFNRLTGYNTCHLAFTSHTIDNIPEINRLAIGRPVLEMTARRAFSLVFVRNATGILLGMKKRGFGRGKWNGFGGKIEPGETVAQGAVRELKEECGLVARNLKNIGLLEFEFEGDPTLLEVHVFETHKYQGNIIESDEMSPKWYDLKDIPFKNMWLDDEHWFPYMLRGEYFKGYFLYRGEDHIIRYSIQVTDNNKPS